MRLDCPNLPPPHAMKSEIAACSYCLNMTKFHYAFLPKYRTISGMERINELLDKLEGHLNRQRVHKPTVIRILAELRAEIKKEMAE